MGKNKLMSWEGVIHRQNFGVKNVDGQNVEWDIRLTEKTSNGKKRRKDKTSNGK
jgi:hypothetical protein